MEKYCPTLCSKDSREYTPPGVTGPSEEEDDEKVLWNFAMETTAHGVGKVAAAKSPAMRAFWIAALLGAFALSVGMISLRLEAYFSYSTVVEVNTIFPDNLTFPAVTFCNFNKVRLSYLQTGNNAQIFDILNDILSKRFNGTEENICSCASTEFQCVAADAAGNQTCCIPSEWECDGKVHCLDGSDEADICAASALNDVFTMKPMISGDEYSVCSTSSTTSLASTGWITSEAFGTGYYRNNLRCAIDLPHHGYRYIIAAIYAKIEYHKACNYDYLMIGSRRICGIYESVVAIDVDTLKNGSSVQISFFSDKNVNDLGFAIHYQYSDTDNGFEVLTSQSETSAAEYFDERFLAYQNFSYIIPICAPEATRYPVLATESYSAFGRWRLISHPGNMNGSSEDYPIGVQCSVSFFPVDGCKIRMEFFWSIYLDGEYSWNCTTDYVLLEYESVSGGIATQKFCGLTSLQPVTTDLGPGEVNVTFITSEYADPSNRTGFELWIRGTPDTSDDNGDGGGGDGEVTDATSSESTATKLDIEGTQFSTKIIEGGWKLNDSLLQCEFRGHTCDESWFDQTLTRFGNCYTFNQENLLTADIVRPLSIPLTQLQPGPAHGLNIKLDVHREEYAESLNTGYAEVGIKFQVHSKSSAPDVENQGLAVGTGRKVYAGFYSTKVQIIEPPWGRCNKSMKLEFSDKYSYQQCAVECKLNYAVRECGCKPYYYPGDIKECTAFELEHCALSAIARLDQGEFSSECNCPVACDYELIDLETSYVEFGSIPSIIDEMNREYYKINDSSRNPRNDSDFYKNNIISFSLYYNDLSYREMRQLKAMDESSLLSDLGGQLGLFIGVSVLTICEMFEAMWLAMTKCMKRRKVLRITEK